MTEQKNLSTANNEKELSKNSSVESSDTKTKQTIPTLYPDIEFINRTLP
jgi:hypothetical protein